mmetsp:Transcript_35202/g.77063  ORF Transcript_35202/g.77063 Transcript_35202/m.77063 type:complete len:180 (+) Transcript_35202:50-589(+)
MSRVDGGCIHDRPLNEISYERNDVVLITSPLHQESVSPPTALAVRTPAQLILPAMPPDYLGTLRGLGPPSLTTAPLRPLLLLRRNLGKELISPLGTLRVVVPSSLVRADAALILALVGRRGAGEVIELPGPAVAAPPVVAAVGTVTLIDNLLCVDRGLGDAICHGLFQGSLVLHPALDP